MVVLGQIESLEIEARDSSVPFCKARQPQNGKGDTAEAGNLPEGFRLGRQRTSAGLSQNLLWSAIDCSEHSVLFLLGACIAVGSLTIAIRFFIPKIQENGRKACYEENCELGDYFACDRSAGAGYYFQQERFRQRNHRYISQKRASSRAYL